MVSNAGYPRILKNISREERKMKKMLAVKFSNRCKQAIKDLSKK
jgi:hypothetical protein